MATSPQVTIGVTSYNALDTVERSIRSAQALDWPALEILVVDDGSVDGSDQIVERLAAADDRIRFVRHASNLGCGAARSTLVREARGDYMAFLDDDDEMLPDRLTVQLKALRQAEQAGLALVACYGSALVVDEKRGETYSGAIARNGAPATGEGLALSILTGDPFPDGAAFGRHPGCTLMASLETFRRVGDFDPLFRRCQDTDWLIRLVLMGGSIVGCHEPVVRQHVTSTPDKAPHLRLRFGIALRRKYRHLLDRHGCYHRALVRTYVEHFNTHGPKWKFRLAVAALFLLTPGDVWRRWFTARRAQWRGRLSRGALRRP
jgi:glycosyltransferase involved in cell wall biosynthesis